MRFSLLALAAGTALTFAPAAQAASIGSPEGLRAAIDGVSITEQAQFLFGGRQYCFYPNGWHGAGWYRCGFHLRRGLGWGGPMGWQGWSYRERGPRFGRGEEFRGRRDFRGERRMGEGRTLRGGTTGQGSQSFEGRSSRGSQGGPEMQRGPQKRGPDMPAGGQGGGAGGGGFGGEKPR